MILLRISLSIIYPRNNRVEVMVPNSLYTYLLVFLLVCLSTPSVDYISAKGHEMSHFCGFLRAGIPVLTAISLKAETGPCEYCSGREANFSESWQYCSCNNNVHSLLSVLRFILLRTK
jgi:hypothetical protein